MASLSVAKLLFALPMELMIRHLLIANRERRPGFGEMLINFSYLVRQFIHTMNKDSVYEAPALIICAISDEAVLCASGDNENYNEYNFDW